MAVVNVSLPPDLLKKIDKYKKINSENRSEFFKNAAELYFKKIEGEIAYRKRLKAIKELMKIGEEIKKEGVFKDIDVVEEIKKMRKERTDELLRRVK